VVLNGADHRLWRGQTAAQLPAAAGPAPALRVWREGTDLLAQIDSTPQQRAPLAGYWAVLLDGVNNRVTAGENAGERLRHDHVVVHYRPVANWPASQVHTERWHLPLDIAHRVAFVVTDASLTRPLQAVVLNCPG
jgi:hypothetical protein